MADDVLNDTLKIIAKQVKEDGNFKTDPIKSCRIYVSNHTPVCLPNVRFVGECNEIAYRLTHLGQFGEAKAEGDHNAGCDATMHAVVRIRLLSRKKASEKKTGRETHPSKEAPPKKTSSRKRK